MQKNKFLKVLFDNELFFPKYKNATDMTFGNYLKTMVLNCISFWSGVIFLGMIILGADMLLNLITRNNGEKHILYFEPLSMNYYVVVSLSVLFSIYALFSLFHYIFYSFDYLGKLLRMSKNGKE
ncbi:hypothetical protein EGY05_07645 [Chryseobacterium arthrosphaerae]|uniref:hypothetical protein n=1 Tax=Chryseobacterium arthrosphaerae TaxID=651561 RepID=UPI000F4FDC20|nr:hypothetical protein [Chryseobacterium arthrosphaerae]AYZ11804.1 hypothetical protein EGY05_07645 [Chryseobacterium arthrosphaerae]